MFRRIDKASAKATDDFDIDLSDPTLSSCCVRDLEDQKRAAVWKAELRKRDPVGRAVDLVQEQAGIFQTKAKACSDHAAPTFPRGQFIETDECTVLASAQTGRFVVCLASDASGSDLETCLREWLDGFQATLLIHRYRSLSCRDCVVDDGIKLPAIVVFANGRKIFTEDRSRLEAESESSLMARLTSLKRMAEASLEDITDSDDEEHADNASSSRNLYKCDRSGCDRQFYHVHVAHAQKNAEFTEEDKNLTTRRRRDSFDE